MGGVEGSVARPGGGRGISAGMGGVDLGVCFSLNNKHMTRAMAISY